jgi:DNA end-binding protein Ku
MAAPSIASLSTRLRPVSIPVKVFRYENQGGDRFNLLHKACSSRLLQQHMRQREGVVTDRADMVKEYESPRGYWLA